MSSLIAVFQIIGKQVNKGVNPLTPIRIALAGEFEVEGGVDTKKTEYKISSC
jgi:hypothetical protein